MALDYDSGIIPLLDNPEPDPRVMEALLKSLRDREVDCRRLMHQALICTPFNAVTEALVIYQGSEGHWWMCGVTNELGDEVWFNAVTEDYAARYIGDDLLHADTSASGKSKII